MSFHSFRDIRGQRLLIEQLMRPVKTGRIVHAQIFAGPDGVGRRSAAELTARALNCAGEGEKPCGACPSCRQFLAGTSPNLIVLTPERNAIRVDAVRDLIGRLNIKPMEGGVVCVIIEDADRMNENAQNALLKTLEETPSYAAFFLICEKTEALLPTIRSRCALARFAPLSQDDCVKVLADRGVDEARAEQAASEAGGCPGQALALLEDDSYAPLRARALDALARVRAPEDVADAFGAIKDDKDDAARILRIYESAAARLIRAQAGAEEARGEIQTLNSNGVSGARLMKSVIETAQKLKANVAYTSAMEMLFFDMTSQEDL